MLHDEELRYVRSLALLAVGLEISAHGAGETPFQLVLVFSFAFPALPKSNTWIRTMLQPPGI